MCVQNFDDSRSFAIRITYRISLRSSSLWEPRHPLLQVVHRLNQGWDVPLQAINHLLLYQVLCILWGRTLTQVTSLLHNQHHYRLYSYQFLTPRKGDCSAGHRPSITEGVAFPLHIYGSTFYSARTNVGPTYLGSTFHGTKNQCGQRTSLFCMTFLIMQDTISQLTHCWAQTDPSSRPYTSFRPHQVKETGFYSVSHHPVRNPKRGNPCLAFLIMQCTLTQHYSLLGST